MSDVCLSKAVLQGGCIAGGKKTPHGGVWQRGAFRPNHGPLDELAHSVNLIPVGTLRVAEDGDATQMREVMLRTAPLAAASSPEDNSLTYIAIYALGQELPVIEVIEASVYDVIVVGGGPAGLASAMSAVAEGLTTLLIEGAARDRQPYTRPTAGDVAGSNPELADLACTGLAERRRFGSRLASACDAIGLVASSPFHQIKIEGGKIVAARAVVIATGAQYRRLDLPDEECFENRGIHYAATGMEAAHCVEEDVLIVGGGSSAGQAAVFLSGMASHVHILIRGEDLQAGMSSYLVERILYSPNITLHPFSEVLGLSGGRSLEKVTWRNTVTGALTSCATRNIFVMIGAIANNSWLREQVMLDDRGFVRAGMVATDIGHRFTTSCPGVFVVGDIRSGSVKRVSAAIREGSAVTADICRYLDGLTILQK